MGAGDGQAARSCPHVDQPWLLDLPGDLEELDDHEFRFGARDRRAIAVLAVGLALILCGGHPETAFVSAIVVLLWALWRLWDAQGRFQVEAPKHANPRPRGLWQHGMRATHTSCVVKHHKGAPLFDIVCVDIEEVMISVVKAEAIAVFVIDGVDKRHNGSLILWAGGT